MKKPCAPTNAFAEPGRSIRRPKPITVALAGFAKGEFHWMILSGNWGWSPAVVAGLDPES